jgi:hypothetical protein
MSRPLEDQRMAHLLAYIDPGSGSLIIQAIIATLIAVPIFFRQQIARFADVVRRRDGGDPTGNDAPR